MTGSSPVPGRRLLAAVGAWLVANVILYGGLAAGARLGARRFYLAHLGDVMAATLCLAYLILFAALWASFGGARGLRDTLGFRFTSLADIAAAPVVWILTLVVGVVAAAPLSRWLGAPRSNATDLVGAAHDPVAAVLLVGSVVVLAPVCEEMLFRGGIFGWLRGKIPVALAAPVSAALFAGLHFFPPGFVVLFVFGVSAALFYQRTGSTLNSCVMHMCQNITAVVAVYSGLGGGR